MLIAQITDMHVVPDGELMGQVVPTNAMLAAAVALALRHVFRLPWWAAGVAACLAHWLYVFSPSAIHKSFRYDFIQEDKINWSAV